MNAVPAERSISLPLGSIIDRYVAKYFLTTFFVTLLCIVVVYLIVDFFDHLGRLLEAGATISAMIRYFLFKIPFLLSQVFGFATLFSVLFCLGLLSRSKEITAMRAAGLSLRRIALPLLLASFLIGLTSFLWSETLVPLFTRKAHYIYTVEVKKKNFQTMFGNRGIWIRGKDAFISTDYFDSQRNTLQGVVIYLLNREFSLKGFIEASYARWDGSRWETSESTQWTLLPDGQLSPEKKTLSVLPISETPADFQVLARKPEEFTVFDLKKQIDDLNSKGIDTTEYQTDLQMKLAFPFIPPLMVFLAIPFALRQGLRGGIAVSLGLTMLIGLPHITLLSFCWSLGKEGVLQPWFAAWFPNLLLGLLGAYFASGEE
ncbi:MAG: LPS export ABC transporter permease LptG [Deltaproteobacteria bacterium]|nr:LPS export ABC transporter permease LptG [Deltaproteobacteria bacterium]